MNKQIYRVNEIFYSLQGEGKYVGTPMIFIRLAGCNLNCTFCDTQYSTYEEMSLGKILTIVNNLNLYAHMPVCITGGEPTIQDLKPLTDVLANDAHLETNGTLPITGDFKHICLSPKSLDVLKENYRKADAIKYLCGCYGWADLIEVTIKNAIGKDIYLQPLKGFEQTAVDYVKMYPYFKLSLQMHKYLNIK